VKDPYKILGVARNATDQEITSAYRTLAAKHHPDKNSGDKEATGRFIEATEAREMLKPENRAKTDMQLFLARLHSVKRTPPSPPPMQVRVSPEVAEVVGAMALGAIGGMALVGLLGAIFGDDS